MGTDNPLARIRAFLQLDERVATGGMPVPDDFQEIADAGYKWVVNLALPTSENAIANEGDLVASLGMRYAHIPVKFDSPDPEDYRTFERLMDAISDQKVFVHCAANMRVSAFMYLYRVRKGMAVAEGREAMLKIWEPEGAWADLVASLSPPSSV